MSYMPQVVYGQLAVSGMCACSFLQSTLNIGHVGCDRCSHRAEQVLTGPKFGTLESPPPLEEDSELHILSRLGKFTPSLGAQKV